MANYTWETRVTRSKRYILPTPWPQGAAIGELYKMLAAVENELGDDATSDDRAWVTTEDDQVVIYFELPAAATDGETKSYRCPRCGDTQICARCAPELTAEVRAERANRPADGGTEK